MGQVATEQRHRLLVIEDEPDLRDLLTYNLEAAGYDVRTAATGEAGLETFRTFAPELLLLDLMLSDTTGIEICRRIRGQAEVQQPIVVMLTAKGDEIDRVVGFEVGADDYVVKPFSMRELLLRVRAQLRPPAELVGAGGEAAGRGRPRRSYQVGPLKLDLDEHRVLVEDQEITVSALEMRLLAYLAQSVGLVCARGDLLTNVWHYSPGVTTRTVDTHVKRLRDKLGKAGPLIQTVRGMGYRLEDPTTQRRRVP